jgi:hypothetical protein
MAQSVRFLALASPHPLFYAVNIPNLRLQPRLCRFIALGLTSQLG